MNDLTFTMKEVKNLVAELVFVKNRAIFSNNQLAFEIF